MQLRSRLTSLPEGSRPKNYEQFLIHAIADNPIAAEGSYLNWEFDHGLARRFFVSGMRWFLRVSGFNAKELETFLKAAVALLDDPNLANVVNMPNSGELWVALSRNQIKAARDKEPMYFQKCVLIILACELAANAALEAFDNGEDSVLALRGKALHANNLTSALDIHQFMAVVPAVWNIDDFAQTFEELCELGPDAVHAVKDKAGQRTVAVLNGLACIDQHPAGMGRTVTYDTATRVKEAINSLYPTIWVGSIRATPGNRHGRGNAMKEEVANVS